MTQNAAIAKDILADLQTDVAVSGRVDEREINRFVAYISDYSPALTVFHTPADGKGDFSGRTFNIPADTQAVVSFIRNRNADKQNIYWSPNFSRINDKKPSKGDMTAALFMWADCDPSIKKFGSYGAARAHLVGGHAQKLKSIASLIIDSGNGLQAFFRMDEPFALADGLKAYEDVNKAIGQAFEGPSTFNADRVMRFPGTVNWPTPSKLAKGYPDAPGFARIVSITDRAYTLAELDELAAEHITAPDAGATSAPVSPSEATRYTLEDETLTQAQERFRRLLETDDALSARWNGDTEGLQDDTSGRSEADHSMVGMLKARRFSLGNIIELMRDFAHGSDNRQDEARYERAMQRSFERTAAVAMAPAAVATEDDFDARDATPEELAAKKSDEVRKPFLGALEDSYIGDFLETRPKPRRFVVKGLIPLGVTVVLAAAGGTGKSQFALQTAMSVATGDTLCGHWEVEETGASLLIFAEDEKLENHRRARNAFDQMTAGDSPSEIARKREAVAKNVRIKSLVGSDARLLSQEQRGGWTVHKERVQDVIDYAKQIPNLKAIVLDPASRFRGGDENDNEGATRFVQVAERISEATGATVIVTAHVNKGSARAGDDSSGAIRGASGLPDGARMALLMRTMSEKDAADMRIPKADRWRYVRMDTMKFNYGPAVIGKWLEKPEARGGYLERWTPPAEPKPVSAAQQALDDEASMFCILRRVRDDAMKTIYRSEKQFREEYGGADNCLHVSDSKLRELLAALMSENKLVIVPDPDRRRGVKGVLALAPGVKIPDEHDWATDDPLDVTEDEEALA